ncbi:MAG: two pore domain potassium channel family protein [Acidobacteria bacterium]|nr:MAG: two pore domain potassium channel family protein [Acidobacteriota bacterium]
MRAAASAIGIAMIVLVLLDAFETIVLPRRVTRPFRLTTLFYRLTWKPWRVLAAVMRPGRRRETFLSFFGPLSLLMLLGTWAAGLTLGFGLLQWGLGAQETVTGRAVTTFWDVLYMSGSTFFTLGLGDVLPKSGSAKFFTILECAMGIAFLGLIIGYLPVIYQSFSERERTIALLDSRAGSPPTAFEVLRRAVRTNNVQEVILILQQFESWAADILESHISYPVLCLYRSQHDNQSWLAALMTILDLSALVMVGVDGIPPAQARLTFAMARHTVVDLTQIFNTPPIPDGTDRLPPEKLAGLRKALREQGVELREDAEATEKLTRLRALYEPHAKALAKFLVLTMPPFRAEKERKDNWQTSAWKKIEGSDAMMITEEHF